MVSAETDWRHSFKSSEERLGGQPTPTARARACTLGSLDTAWGVYAVPLWEIARANRPAQAFRFIRGIRSKLYNALLFSEQCADYCLYINYYQHTIVNSYDIKLTTKNKDKVYFQQI